MGKDIPGGPDQGTLSGRALLAQALTQDPKAIALFAASGNPEDLHFESPSPRENMEMRRRNVNAYLKFLNEHEIGGSDLRAALKTHEKDVETVMRNGRHPEHAYHKAFFHFDAFNQKIFDHLRSNISGDSDVSIPEHFQCTPIWAKYSGDIAADKVEETAYALMEYLNKLSHILMISQVKTNGENIEEKLMAIETIVEFFKRLQPLTGIPWQSFRNLQNPDFFQDSDDSDVKNLAAINRPIPETAEFIGDESMMAYNLIKAAYAAMDFHEGDAFSKTDRQKARAYFQEHREEMGKRVYLWDNLLKEVFDRADVIFPDEGIIDIERAGVIRRSEDALAGGAVVEQQPSYEDHYYGE